jgi:two-component sensor histidine kinase
VINSLKHAFLENQGKITVTFETEGEDWTLAVVDDGIGMPTGPNKANPGLGSSLIEALAQKLDADIVVAGANPGTKVLLTHQGVADGASKSQEPQHAV